jgi:SAM-dependent methyltransferase
MDTAAVPINQDRPYVAQPDLAAVKARQRGAWSSGDYAVVGTTLQIVGEELCEALDVRAGQTVHRRRRGQWQCQPRRRATLVRCDCDRLCPCTLLERARERAAAERLEIAFREADAEELPFDDESFDVVMSTFGVMFTPDQERAAAELVRVCRRGGRIGLANWTPDGFIGQLFKTLGKVVPPPTGVRSPALWGTRARIDELFGKHASEIRTAPREFVFRYRSPAHWIHVFKSYYGPLLKAFASLDATAQAALERDVSQLIARFNRSRDGTMVVPSEYLESRRHARLSQRPPHNTYLHAGAHHEKHHALRPDSPASAVFLLAAWVSR